MKDLSVIDVRTKSALFDYFIIATVESNKQSDAIIHEFKKTGIQVHHIEKTDDGSWVLIDCFDCIVHLFTEEKRKEYNLESIWQDTVKILKSGR